MSNLKLVAWSGGCDSTLALFKALQNQKTWICGGKTLYEVQTLSINWLPIPQCPQQRAARKKITARLRSLGYRFAHREVDITATSGAGTCASQAVLWVGIAQQFLEANQDLVTGWIRGDDVWHRIADLRAAFEHLRLASSRADSALETPLEWHTKRQVIEELEKAGLLDLCWWCENPAKVKGRSQPCGHACTPCQTHAVAKFQRRNFPMNPRAV